MRISSVATFTLALLTLIFAVSCEDSPEEELFLEPEVWEDDHLYITIEPVEVTDNSIEVKATIVSLGSLKDRPNMEYGFIWFESELDSTASPESIPQNKVHIGTLKERDSFTFRTTITELNKSTSYNVCTFLEDGTEIMIGEEIVVETL